MDIASTGSAQWIVDFKELRGAMLRVATATECGVTYSQVVPHHGRAGGVPLFFTWCSVFHMEKLRSQTTQ